ncbi:hypothetical protein [Paenibacillus oceani]|uniref:HTH cro/C1-type domain-containing protein n=1 Tax=Paenibacillus oceani TaxID=2772510 RepID=A0A927C7C1_9BACL|nr:hypothetical protein [Paenibacillus oceani]MBD2860680.1 hypothetical protein [Paenibacillus oceani]
MLTAAPFEQRKTLLHLFIKRITMNESKKIETIELSFDENVDSYFSDSPVAAAAGDSLQRKQARKREKIDFAGGVERGERNLSLENIGKIVVALDVEPKLLFEFDEPFMSPVSDEKEAVLQEVLAILKGKDVAHIRMSKNILAEIFNML